MTSRHAELFSLNAHDSQLAMTDVPDMAIKEAALARTTPPNTPPGRYRPPDTLLAFLEAV